MVADWANGKQGLERWPGAVLGTRTDRFIGYSPPLQVPPLIPWMAGAKAPRR
jgi:hypothetical protein